MTRIRLVHWHQKEAIEHAGRLRDLGYAVDSEPIDAPGVMRALREEPPNAIVIDLARLPSHGRSIGYVLRASKSTRLIPLVFIEGDPDKTERVRALLPDAMFTTWMNIKRDLRKAISRPPRNPIVPRSESGAAKPTGYSGTPLPKKLGIKEGASVGLIAAPKRFEMTLGALPANVRIRREPRLKCDVVLCFAKSTSELEPRMRKAMKVSADSGLWLIWPKKSSGVASDLSEGVVRTMGLAAGWVDFKVCAIDATWSGHKFARRKK